MPPASARASRLRRPGFDLRLACPNRRPTPPLCERAEPLQRTRELRPPSAPDPRVSRSELARSNVYPKPRSKLPETGFSSTAHDAGALLELSTRRRGRRRDPLRRCQPPVVVVPPVAPPMSVPAVDVGGLLGDDPAGGADHVPDLSDSLAPGSAFPVSGVAIEREAAVRRLAASVRAPDRAELGADQTGPATAVVPLTRMTGGQIFA